MNAHISRHIRIAADDNNTTDWHLCPPGQKQTCILRLKLLYMGLFINLGVKQTTTEIH